MAWETYLGYSIGVSEVSEDDATEEAEENQLAENLLTLRDALTAYLPGKLDNIDPGGLAREGAKNESGAVFTCWCVFEHEDTKTLVDASDYVGIVPDSMSNHGFYRRWVEVYIWASNSGDESANCPAGGTPENLNDTPGRMGFWADADLEYEYTDGNYHYIFTLNNDGDLRCAYTDPVAGNEASVVFWITVSPRYIVE